jgi:hypothetical protein
MKRRECWLDGAKRNGRGVDRLPRLQSQHDVPNRGVGLAWCVMQEDQLAAVQGTLKTSVREHNGVWTTPLAPDPRGFLPACLEPTPTRISRNCL